MPKSGKVHVGGSIPSSPAQNQTLLTLADWINMTCLLMSSLFGSCLIITQISTTYVECDSRAQGHREYIPSILLQCQEKYLACHRYDVDNS